MYLFVTRITILILLLSPDSIEEVMLKSNDMLLADIPAYILHHFNTMFSFF